MNAKTYCYSSENSTNFIITIHSIKIVAGAAGPYRLRDCCPTSEA